MSDIDKTLYSLPVLAIAVLVLLAVNRNPSLLDSFSSPSPPQTAPTRLAQPFDDAPYQLPPNFPDAYR